MEITHIKGNLKKNISGGGADTSGRPHHGTDQQAGNGQVGSE